MPEFGALLGNFSKFFEARRPLRPERKVVKRRVKDQVKEPKIIVSIRNAQNLPVRTTKYDEEVRFYSLIWFEFWVLMIFISELKVCSLQLKPRLNLNRVAVLLHLFEQYWFDFFSYFVRLTATLTFFFLFYQI